MEMSVQLAARRRQVALTAFSDASGIGYRAQVRFVSEPGDTNGDLRAFCDEVNV